MTTEKISLDELSMHLDSSKRPFQCLPNKNLGNTTLVATIPTKLFFEMSEVRNGQEGVSDNPEIAQRKLDRSHARGFSRYVLQAILKSLLNRQLKTTENSWNLNVSRLTTIMGMVKEQAYYAMQPVVVNLKCDSEPETRKIGPSSIEIMLSERDILWVIDGQHRRMALKYFFDFLSYIRTKKKYPSTNGLIPKLKGKMLEKVDIDIWDAVYQEAVQHSTILAEIHLGLNVEQERQLFHDLNGLGKKMNVKLVQSFDSSNPVLRFVLDHLLKNDFISSRIDEGDGSNENQLKFSLTRKDLLEINSYFFSGKISSAKVDKDSVVNMQSAALNFWSLVCKRIDANKSSDRLILKEPLFLKGIALFFNKELGSGNDDQTFRLFEKIDFSSSNEDWKIFYDKTTAPQELIQNLPAKTMAYLGNMGEIDQNGTLILTRSRQSILAPIIYRVIKEVWSSLNSDFD